VFFILLYRCLDWGKVFLVTHVYVIKQRTLTGQKRAADLQTLCMPVFTLLLFLGRVKRHILLHLNNKPDFRAVTEVADCEVRDLLDE
jgi:hypothetical protein